VIAAVTADFFLTSPRYSLVMTDPVEALAVLVFLAVAGIISTLIDRLARRGMEVARAQAEAHTLPDLVAQLRRTFAMDCVAVDGREALIAATRHVPDLILLDIGLDDMSGIDVIRAARLDQGADPGAVRTGQGPQEARADANPAPAADHRGRPGLPLPALKAGRLSAGRWRFPGEDPRFPSMTSGSG
jgi:CheY-like chemotaxis protein